MTPNNEYAPAMGKSLGCFVPKKLKASDTLRNWDKPYKKFWALIKAPSSIKLGKNKKQKKQKNLRFTKKKVW